MHCWNALVVGAAVLVGEVGLLDIGRVSPSAGPSAIVGAGQHRSRTPVTSCTSAKQAPVRRSTRPPAGNRPHCTGDRRPSDKRELRRSLVSPAAHET